ncbi:NAD(P)H-hydrate dehydratase [Undibacterium parvum]|uniref:Bifunctional NAD(P)H-hydrate repair enzyme n=1 Tax=Undibacterium parvum TaxID=401471 RepID=A0A3S9HP37_9BURK|nr:NAD(P)H-hydrate dehydratase [Undibacterium parvum]AZP13883.1 NAD(P)H-hydrate dehydratase [Undibacterium parvum]
MNPAAPSNSFTHALYRKAEIRAIEAAAIADLPAGELMRAAGKAASELVQTKFTPRDGAILILAGPGDNGGDALETGQLLAARGYTVDIALCADSLLYSAAANLSLQQARASRATFISLEQILENQAPAYALVIDGLFGIGLSRAITADSVFGQLIQHINQLAEKFAIPILALDVPSGLDADTGQVIGPQGVAIEANTTLSFIADKVGLHTAAGRDYAGRVLIDSLGVADNHFPPPSGILSHAAMFAGLLPARRLDSHKGSYGEVMVIGGAHGMMGAAILAASAALYCGAGRVYVGFIDAAPAYDAQHPELMCRMAAELDFSKACVVIGPGLGNSELTASLLARALQQAPYVVIDADALNLIASSAPLRALLLARSQSLKSSIMTPHPLEAARLLGISTAQVQADRWQAALDLASQFQATIILKGAGSIIATSQQPLCINTSGNPALASGGTGDVLAGVCGALLAQQMAANDAARMAVWLHGCAADQLVEHACDAIGLTASELIPAIRNCLNQQQKKHSKPQRFQPLSK